MKRVLALILVPAILLAGCNKRPPDNKTPHQALSVTKSEMS